MGLLPDADVVVEAVVLVTAERVLTHIKPKWGRLVEQRKRDFFFVGKVFPAFFPPIPKRKIFFFSLPRITPIGSSTFARSALIQHWKQKETLFFFRL